LAEKIKPHKDSIGNNSAYEWWIRIGDGEHTALCNFNHHIGTTGRQHYESSAPMAELIEAYAEAGRWHGESPNIVVRCLSDDTEILTKNGWGKIDDVNIGNEVMTFNAFNNALQWQTVSNKVVNDNEPEMIQMIGKGMDICVTPDHNMVVRTHTGRWGSLGWKPMQMQDVLHVIKNKGKCGAQLQIPVSGLYDGAVPVNLTNEQLWLTGFFMADGSYVRNSNGARYAMRIHQADEKRNEVESCLYNAGIISGVTSCTNAKEGTSHFDSRKSRWIYTRKNCSTWYIPKEYSELYFEYLDDDKCLNACMMNMTKEQFVFLLNGFHYGDGAANSNRIFNANEKMLDQLQELMVKHGYKSNLHYNDMYTTKRGVKKRTGVLNYIPDCIAIGIGQKNNHQITSIPWNGKSWCVTVPNGTLVTRRNGCVAIVGNSHRHRFIEVKVSTAGGDGIVVVTPGWQLATPFVQKLPGGRTSTPQIGGILLRAGDEEHFTRHKIWNIERAPEVVI
jgi:ribonucleoside-triphosphate reductase